MTASSIMLLCLLFAYACASSVFAYRMSGTAGRYTRRENSSCSSILSKVNGYVAAVSDDLWYNTSSCGKMYNLTCDDSLADQNITHICKSPSIFIIATIVDHCKSCAGKTIELPTEAFSEIATYDANSSLDVINIVYTEVGDGVGFLLTSHVALSPSQTDDSLTVAPSGSPSIPGGGFSIPGGGFDFSPPTDYFLESSGSGWKPWQTALIIGAGVITLLLLILSAACRWRKENRASETDGAGRSDGSASVEARAGEIELGGGGSIPVDSRAGVGQQNGVGRGNVRSVSLEVSQSLGLNTSQKQAQASLVRYESRILKHYTYAEVSVMTDNFREKLGSGGFGTVFRGKLDGKDVAVKRLNGKGEGIDFGKEVDSLTRIAQKNCINLIGYCADDEGIVLIYPFMKKGSLEKLIHAPDKSDAFIRFGWESRFKVAVGIARGLDYLHTGCEETILHLDIKPHNILLGDDFEPKLSDFGLAKLMYPEKSVSLATTVVGTYGYTAPEVLVNGMLSTKADVYGFGMLLLEMVGGRKNASTQSRHSQEIYAISVYNRLAAGKDLNLYGVTSNNRELALKMVRVGLFCIQRERSLRPEMTKVIEMLKGSLTTLEEKMPVHPFYGGPDGPSVLPLDETTTILTGETPPTIPSLNTQAGNGSFNFTSPNAQSGKGSSTTPTPRSLTGEGSSSFPSPHTLSGEDFSIIPSPQVQAGEKSSNVPSPPAQTGEGYPISPSTHPPLVKKDSSDVPSSQAREWKKGSYSQRFNTLYI